MLGAVLAQRQTGAAINVHPGRHPDQPQEVADFIRVKGGRMDRVIISHIDRTVFDDERLRRLADTGCVLEWDLFGQESSYYRLADIDMPNDAVRLRAKRRRDNAPSLIFAIDLNQHPCLVHPVLASPICIAQEMGAGPEKDVDDPSTGHDRLFVRNLYEESCRHLRSPSC